MSNGVPEWARPIYAQMGRWEPALPEPQPYGWISFVQSAKSPLVRTPSSWALNDRERDWIIAWLSRYSPANPGQIVDYVALGIGAMDFFESEPDGELNPSAVISVTAKQVMADDRPAPGSQPASVSALLLGAGESLKQRAASWLPTFTDSAPPYWVVLTSMPGVLDVLRDVQLGSTGGEWLARWLGNNAAIYDESDASYVVIGLGSVDFFTGVADGNTDPSGVISVSWGSDASARPGAVMSTVKEITALWREALLVGWGASIASEPGEVVRGLLPSEDGAAIGNRMSVEVRTAVHETIHSCDESRDLPFGRFWNKAAEWGVRYTDFIAEYQDSLLNSQQLQAWLEDIPLFLREDVLNDNERRAGEKLLELAQVAYDIAGYLFVAG